MPGVSFICMPERSARPRRNFKRDSQSKRQLFSELFKAVDPGGNSAYFLHHLFDDFRKPYPNVNFDFYEIPSDFAIPNVLNHVTEIGLIRSSLPGYASLAVYPYEKEEIVAVCSPDHPLVHKSDILDISRLADYPLAVPFDCLDLVRSSFATACWRRIFPSLPPPTRPPSSGPDPSALSRWPH